MGKQNVERREFCNRRNSSLPEFDNAGAMMTMDENPQCSFQILRPTAKKPKFGVGSVKTIQLT